MQAGKSNQLTVLLVDDHAVVREGYRRLLERSSDILVVGEAADAQQAQRLFRELSPQIVVMDITLPGMSGLEAMRQMLQEKPETRVLVFSMHEDAIFAKRALQGGACGYVTKASAPSILIDALHRIAGGAKYLSADIAQTLALSATALDRSASDGLSARELEVLRLLAQGQSIKQIAHSMGLNPKTVFNHQSAIKQKLGAGSAVQLLSIAKRLGLESASG